MSAQTWEDFGSVTDVREMADVASSASVAMQSQYAHAPNLTALADVIQSGVEATEDLTRYASEVSDPQSAKGVFLDWWGDRVGVARLISVGGEYVRFDDDYFRFLIFYRAACNLAGESAAVMNRMLSTLTDQAVFIVDYQNMSINSIVVVGEVSDLQTTILRAYGLLNRPAGVLTNFLVIYPDDAIFGFDGQNLNPFDQGVFNPGQEFSMETDPQNADFLRALGRQQQ